ncbi:MAG: hypothetical protein WBK42_05780 [Dethiobacteria bacterium]
MNRKRRFYKLFLISAVTLIMLLLIAPMSIFAGKKLSYNLQGWSEGENKWAEGSLKGYTEEDWVTFRVVVTGYNGEEIKGLVIEHGRFSKKGHPGFQEADDFKIVDITTGLPGADDVIYDSNAFVVTGPTIKTEPSGDEYIVYTIEITDADVRDALKSKGSFAIYWEAKLAIGSSQWPGATLKTSFQKGKQTISIKDVSPRTVEPSLKVTKSADVESYSAVDQVITYTITVENTGNVTLTDITVTDPTATITGGSLIASLAPGETATVTATYTVTQADLDAGGITNTATASTVYNDETIADDDSVTILAVASPSLKVEKSSEGTFKEAGDLITYYVKVTNTGNVTLTGIQVRDDMLGLNETIDSLSPGESRTFTGTYTVKESDLEGNLVNTASAQAVYKDEVVYDEDSLILTPQEPPLVEPEYNITTQSQPAEGGSTSGDGIYKQGTIVTVKATANSGYVFTGWFENEVKVSDSAEYQFTVVRDRHLVAHFQGEMIIPPEKPKTDPHPEPDFPLPRTSGMAGALGLSLLLLAGGIVLRRFSR